MGRHTGVGPVHARFTAECVHRFTNGASGSNIRERGNEYNSHFFAMKRKENSAFEPNLQGF